MVLCDHGWGRKKSERKVENVKNKSALISNSAWENILFNGFPFAFALTTIRKN